MDPNGTITYLGETDFRNKKTRFGIKQKDRARHVYVIGKTGMGKSVFLENMAVQDIKNGNGLAVLDPHGSMAEKLLEYIPEERIKDVVYVAPFDLENPISFNVLENIGDDKRHLVASGLMSTFKKIWADAWSARMEYILNNTLLALLEYPGATLLMVNKMLSDKEFRKKVVDNVTDPSVKSFWVDEFAKYTEKFAAEATPAIQNKIGQFTANPVIRNIIGQSKSSFDIRQAMDEKKIVIVNLSKGRIGEASANLLGGMFITKIYLAAMSRAEASEKELASIPPFYLYVDEFQSFASDSFADILSEARKYKLGLVIAHQFVEQMSDAVRAAVFGNVGTTIVFRVGATDAELFEKEFSGVFVADDLVNLGFTQIYLRLMIDGVGSKPFSATTLPPIELPEISPREKVLAYSIEHNTRPRAVVEEDIKQALATTPPPEKPRTREGDGNPRAPYQPSQQAPRGEQNNHKPFQQAFQKPMTPRPEYKPQERPQTSNQPQNSIPSVKTERPNIPPRAPVTPSPKLKDLLKQLEAEQPEPTVTSASREAAQDLKPTPPPEKKQEMSLSQLKKPASLTASSGNLSKLRETLAEALKSREEKKSDPAPAPKAETPIHKIEIPSEPEIKTASAPKEDMPVSSDYTPRKPKEIPEDLLRKILD